MKLLATIGSRLEAGHAQFGVGVGERNQEAPTREQHRLEIQQEIDRCLEDDAFMERIYDETHPGHQQAFGRLDELHRARDRRPIPADVASLTPEQAQLEINRCLEDDAFMERVYDETRPGHQQAFERFLALHAVSPRKPW